MLAANCGEKYINWNGIIALRTVTVKETNFQNVTRCMDTDSLPLHNSYSLAVEPRECHNSLPALCPKRKLQNGMRNLTVENRILPRLPRTKAIQ